MADKLKHKRNIRHAHLGPQQIVMIVLQLPIREMVPRAPVPIQQRWRLDYLPPILTPATLERLVRLAQGVFAELEELPKGVDGEMSLRILFLVDDSRWQGLFWGLALKDLFFDGTGGDEAVDEAWVRVNVVYNVRCVSTIGMYMNVHSFFCPSRHTRASACWSAAGFQSADIHSKIVS
jgi:hypothetical protein